MSRSGQAPLAQVIVGLVVAVVVGAGAALPVILELVNNSGASGTTRTVIELAPLFIALLLLVVFAGPLMRRVR
jgi:hypothetical protein